MRERGKERKAQPDRWAEIKSVSVTWSFGMKFLRVVDLGSQGERESGIWLGRGEGIASRSPPSEGSGRQLEASWRKEHMHARWSWRQALERLHATNERGISEDGEWQVEISS